MTQRKTIGISILVMSALVLIASVGYMTHLSKRVGQQEQQRIAIWAGATEQFILAGEDENIDFYTQIIEDNTSIPVYMLDDRGNVLLTRNVEDPVKDPTTLHGPIEVRIADDNIQYIYYDDSDVLKQLRFFPYVLVVIILIFIVIATWMLLTQQRSDQDKLWVGLSKETAHQLGTPISSLNAWQELLSATYHDNEMIPEMKQDIHRLEVIADRFSKIGSEPELTDANLIALAQDSVQYMRTRLSKRVQISLDTDGVESLTAHLSPALFGWVLENMIKNSVDAGATEIQLSIRDQGERYVLDLSDNGKGIEGRNPDRIFRPGYTTKKRGWGLGLSLGKRIVEDYHRGELLLYKTEPGVGTTLRIVLKNPEYC